MNKTGIRERSFPRQKLSRKEKNKDWGKDNIDFIIGLSNSSINRHSGESEYQRMKINYDLYNNIINREDFTYVTNPYGIKEEFPARLYNYNIITPKLKLLEGEEIKRPFNFRVAAINSEAVSQIQKKRKELLLRYLESELETELISQGVNVQNPSQAMPPEEIQKYMNHSMNDIREITANRLAQYLIKKENLEFKFNKGFKDANISAYEIYYTGIENGEPVADVVNPLAFTYDKNPEIDFIQDGQWAKYEKFCTTSEIIDAYYDELTESDIEALDSGEVYGKSINLPEGPSTGPIVPINYSSRGLDDGSVNGFTRVVHVEWKSLRKVGFLKYYDENLEEQEMMVDETYIPVKEKGEEVEWAWINEVWEGTKIGDDIYVRIRPKTVQYRSIDNPSICKLGYVGAVYNDRNSVPTSTIDLVKHHQYLYNVIMYRLELEIAKAKGKKMVMDVAQIPRSQGIDLEKWMYYFDTVGIAFINSFEEGKGKFAGQTSQFNQFTAVDMSLSQSVGQYVQILSKIEDMASELMGVSKQRLGSISSTETVGGVERSVMQSSNITEPLFYMHNEIKKHVLTHLIECAKVAYPEGKKINYILGDTERVFLEISDEFVDADYGVFVTNSAKEVKALEDLKRIAENAIASGMISLKEATSIVTSDSLSEVRRTVEAGAQRQVEEKEREYQSQQEAIQAQAQADLEREMAIHDRLDERERIKGEIEKEIKAIEALGFSEDKDVNSNGIPDVFEYDKLQQQAKEHNDSINLEKEKLNLEREKIASEEKKADRDAQLKEKEIAVKKIAAKKKPTSSSK